MNKKVVAVENLNVEQVRKALKQAGHYCARVVIRKIPMTFEEILWQVRDRIAKAGFITCSRNAGQGVAIIVYNDKGIVGSGVARCRDTDTFDYDRGWALATARACGYKDIEQALLKIL